MTLDIFVVAGEESGDILGAGVMAALAERADVRFRGVGGTRMQAAGLQSLFPMEDLTAIGFGEVIGKLPTLLRRLTQTADAIIASPPDLLLLVDAPDFTHRVAKRVRRRLPHLPIVKYVAPTVWVWRPGRARAMVGSIDHVLALLPFEPQVMAELGGPQTTYVGHPLLKEIAMLRPSSEEQARRQADPPLLLVLPGSRGRELKRLAKPFGDAFGILASRGHRFDLVLPTLDRLRERVEEAVADWPVKPRIVTGEASKYAAFRSARAALAASGTVTLELGLAAVPFVAAYQVAKWEGWIARVLARVRSAILVNLILGRNIIPEFLQADCEPGKLANALQALLADGPARQVQLDGFVELEAIMGADAIDPSARAAKIVLSLIPQ